MNEEKALDFLDPIVLKDRLARTSLFIAVYESFKDTIVENVKYFFCSGIEDGRELFEGYEENVLNRAKSKKNRVLQGTLLWLVEVGAISEEDVRHVKRMTDMRNHLAHEMFQVLWQGTPEGMEQLYVTMLELYRSTVRWWYREIEATIDPDMTTEKYASIQWESVTTLAVAALDLMTKTALEDLGRKPQE